MLVVGDLVVDAWVGCVTKAVLVVVGGLWLVFLAFRGWRLFSPWDGGLLFLAAVAVLEGAFGVVFVNDGGLDESFEGFLVR